MPARRWRSGLVKSVASAEGCSGGPAEGAAPGGQPPGEGSARFANPPRTTYAGAMTKFHDLTMTSITGEPQPLSAYAGKTCLIVNVASE